MTFTIDTDNNIAAHAGQPASADNGQTFASYQELVKLTNDWTGTRLVETWNSFAGAAPFNDLKAVKKFTNRKVAIARIWAAIQRLPADDAPQARVVAPATPKTGIPSVKAPRRAWAQDIANERSNKKAEVIALMKRAKGVTLFEIMKLTGWQKHTVRGFVSLLRSQDGQRIESLRNASGHRTYRAAK